MISNLFFLQDSVKLMLQDDQKELENNIKELRDNLPAKVNKLRDAEGQEDIKGFNLKPMDPSEVNTLKFQKAS